MLVIRQAEIYSESRLAQSDSVGKALYDVRCREGKIVEIGPSLGLSSDELSIEANGAALLPGLYDHHMHLMAFAAALESLDCGPPAITNLDALAHALHTADGHGWIRGTGYHESVAGMLDLKQLDKLVPDRPVRIQHRSGKMWFVNSIAADLLNLGDFSNLAGIERDSNGLATGRLFRMDEWLRQQLGAKTLPDIKYASEKLAAFGVTGFTDATVGNSFASQDLFAELIDNGDLLQRIQIMGDKTLTPSVSHHLVETGCFKIILDDYSLPHYEDLKRDIEEAHQQERSVAIHCITRTELVFALTAIRDAGRRNGDRIEHAAVTPDDTLALMRDTGVYVITQPGFVAEKGEHYMQAVAADEYHQLYRCATLMNAGVPVGGSTDAPFGNPDPWHAIRAAVSRQTENGTVLGEEERLSPEAALRLFTSSAANPGGAARVIEVGADADLCLLQVPWSAARVSLHNREVNITIRSAEVIYQCENRLTKHDIKTKADL